MYLKLFSKAILSLGNKIMVFCPQPERMRELVIDDPNAKEKVLGYFEFSAPKASAFPLKTLRPALYSTKLWLASRRAIKTAIATTGCIPDLVFFPWLDDYVGYLLSHYVIDRIFPYNWTGLYFHPYFLRHKVRFLFLRRGLMDFTEAFHSTNCKTVAVLDEGIQNNLQNILKNKLVVVFPDVTDDSFPDRAFPIVHEILEKANGRKIIALVGSIAKRKGMQMLLDIARKTTKENWFFVFVGKFAGESFEIGERAEIQQTLDDQPENCFFHFDFIQGEPQLNALVEASDILFAVYEKFAHSSNILTKAAIFEKPVIVSTGHCMEERVKAYNTGVSVEYGNVQQCIEGIHYLLEQASKKGETAKANYEGYRKEHSMERLTNAFNAIWGVTVSQ